MIWIGTSGWAYKHWIGRFYPPEMPQRDWLTYYAHHFPTVEINRSFYRQPTRQNFEAWAAQTAFHPGFLFAVKATRYITHLKKLRDVDEALNVHISAAEGLSDKLGPFLYQLPPRWRANRERLKEFMDRLPEQYRAAFEFRDPRWYNEEVPRVLDDARCALVIAVGGANYTPPEWHWVGPFRFIRVHNGLYGIGLTDGEIAHWAQKIANDAGQGVDVYVYFNNDPDGHAIYDAFRLRHMLQSMGAPLAW